MKLKSHPAITNSSARYLTVIENLIICQRYARLTDIYRELKISAGSCLTTLKKLITRGLVTEDANKFYGLTEEGKAMADLIGKNEKLLRRFLVDVLGVSETLADKEAREIEHLLSTESCFKLSRFMKLILSDDSSAIAFKNRLKKEPAICWRKFQLKS